jgi:hypothetical protein
MSRTRSNTHLLTFLLRTLSIQPLQVKFSGKATASFTLKPQLTLVLWGIPFRIQPEATIGVDVKIGEGSGCSNVVAPYVGVGKTKKETRIDYTLCLAVLVGYML